MLYDFVIVDVFTNRPFGGNQLAVLTDASGISDAGMQAITREFNFAETSFVLPADDPTCARRIRIFTPGRELPFAGHPTVGTACVLVNVGECEAGLVMLEEAIGPVAVHVVEDNSGLRATLRLQQAPKLASQVPSAAQVAQVLSLPEDEVARVFCAELGVAFTFVQLTSSEAVDRSRLNEAKWDEHLARSVAPQVYVFAGELASGSELYARMFAPAFGIPEDPATGSALAALVGAAPAIVGDTGPDPFTITVHQGVQLGRPSVLRGSAQIEAGKLVAIEVGGDTALVARGQIDVAAEYLTAPGNGLCQPTSPDAP